MSLEIANLFMGLVAIWNEKESRFETLSINTRIHSVDHEKVLKKIKHEDQESFIEETEQGYVVHYSVSGDLLCMCASGLIFERRICVKYIKDVIETMIGTVPSKSELDDLVKEGLDFHNDLDNDELSFQKMRPSMVDYQEEATEKLKMLRGSLKTSPMTPLGYPLEDDIGEGDEARRRSDVINEPFMVKRRTRSSDVFHLFQEQSFLYLDFCLVVSFLSAIVFFQLPCLIPCLVWFICFFCFFADEGEHVTNIICSFCCCWYCLLCCGVPVRENVLDEFVERRKWKEKWKRRSRVNNWGGTLETERETASLDIFMEDDRSYLT